MQWVSVEEGLPDKEGDYLTWYVADGQGYHDAYWALGVWDGKSWGSLPRIVRITYWQPGPQPPKGVDYE